MGRNGVKFDLSQLSEREPYNQELHITFTAETPSGPLSKEFSKPVSEIRDKRAPRILNVKPGDCSQHKAPFTFLKAESAADDPIENVVINANGSNVTVYPKEDSGPAPYTLEVKERVALKSGGNIIEIIATDHEGRQTVKTVELRC